MFKVNGYKVIELPDFVFEDGAGEATVAGIFDAVKNATKPILTDSFKIDWSGNIHKIPAMFTPFFYNSNDNILFARVLAGDSDNTVILFSITSEDVVRVEFNQIVE